jgi:hypothetical protein
MRLHMSRRNPRHAGEPDSQVVSRRLQLNRAWRANVSPARMQIGPDACTLARVGRSVLLQKRKRTRVPRRGCRGSPLRMPSHLPARRGSVIASVAVREKKKGPGPCELRGPCCVTSRRVHVRAWPKAHHRASPNFAFRQRPLCSGARPSAQPKSLARRDRNRFRSPQGRVTTATPIPGGVLDFTPLPDDGLT